MSPVLKIYESAAFEGPCGKPDGFLIISKFCGNEFRRVPKSAFEYDPFPKLLSSYLCGIIKSYFIETIWYVLCYQMYESYELRFKKHQRKRSGYSRWPAKQ
jgi:hypothetical protein